MNALPHISKWCQWCVHQDQPYLAQGHLVQWSVVSDQGMGIQYCLIYRQVGGIGEILVSFESSSWNAS